MLVLIAEDNIENQEILSRRLTRHGYDVCVVSDGKEAVERATCGNPLPDLILMDISMPVMSGLEATETIRRVDGFKNLPIIALTAHAMEGDREKCMEAGCTDFATKPVHFKGLIGMIETLTQSEVVSLPAKQA